MMRKLEKPFGLISHPSCTSQVIHLMYWFLLRITKAKRRITPFDQVLIALQFYGTGTFQTVVENVLKYSQAAVCRSIHDLKRKFAEIARIPGIIGCIDCTHIRIQRPHQHEYAFVNRKGYHSINVQVCINRTFIYVLYRAYGFYFICVHDSTMFKTSALGLQCVQGEFGEGFLLGDSDYGSTPYLITPFNIPSNDEEVKFNRSHKRTRCVIERAFGAVKRRFHCLHGEIRVQPQRTCKYYTKNL
ncbi:F14D2.9-like protein [Daphnia magna]|uniref:F14D2.9-like protein n=1 Tax=Daphnia magna TaxID=35525 RepID=A0A164MXP9_9CRUS|nr:F14D2.9-like protein [Daphnia magna]